MQKRLIIVGLLVFLNFIITDSFAQQDAQYTQYMYNTISVNPAYAGSRGVTSIIGLHRSQWVGIDGAPRTQTLSATTPLGPKNRIGLGFSAVNDAIGPTNETFFGIDFAYIIPMSDEANLSFGLKASGHLLNVDFNELSQFDIGDANFQNNIENRFSPNVGVGVYYHTDNYYFGLSAPSLVETKHFDQAASSTSFLAEEKINYYMIAGYVFDFNDRLKFKPAILTKAVSGAPLQVDISANFLLNERLILGAAYRWSAAFSALVGFQATESMLIGFAYDRETTELGSSEFNSGSYELLVSFELRKLFRTCKCFF